MPKIKIIDLFAGPGGLGEGFSSYQTDDGNFPFEIVASVEKEASAHQTLQLRSFFRKFPRENVPDEYYQYVRGDGVSRTQLFEKYPEQSKAAIAETLGGPTALGVDNELIHAKIAEVLAGFDGPKMVIGGPPCQAYSLVGRSRNKGKAGYSAKKDLRHFLYKEYLEILHLVQPHVFVMENVKGILSSKVEGEHIFPRILNDLKNPGEALLKDSKATYKIYSFVTEPLDRDGEPGYKKNTDFIIRSENYGIPQARHRVILLGVRSDIAAIPGLLKLAPKVSVGDVLESLPKLRSGISKRKDNATEWYATVERAKNQLVEILRKNDQSDLVRHILSSQRFHHDLGRGARYVPSLGNAQVPNALSNWYFDGKLHGVLNHETRGHMYSDLQRYLYCSYFVQNVNDIENNSPKAKDFPKELAPNHQNWESGKFADRFRVQSRNRFATTITSHISKDGHYFIHYDPAQCRSLTVREAARLQTFPDNYFFEGNRTEQYVQVGNAVPPFLAKQIAHIVQALLSS
ncbi:DNA cytosine methyltransferase [Undibacterium rugosum]|uniref:DNA cytosine methyltransferase n=1 Tax=Undibacterium rugosum TaxID=2762291 RepID=UPI001B81C46E|nr:DNA cytosine methyltransferase [Undibacterium rugosum]MBR7777576.1 DNA cytosine methyltransferase [Undibacterium rugosum]